MTSCRNCNENAAQMQQQQDSHQRKAAEMCNEIRTLESQVSVLKTKLHDADRGTTDLQGKRMRLEEELSSLKSAAADKASEAAARSEEIRSLQSSLKSSEVKVHCSVCKYAF